MENHIDSKKYESIASSIVVGAASQVDGIASITSTFQPLDSAYF